MNEGTIDAIEGLGLVLRQMITGHRVGLDAVLLAAAVEAAPRHLVDVGAGVGAVGLALARRFPQAQATLIEVDPETAALAAENARRNEIVNARVSVFDALDPAARRSGGLADAQADLVVTNPPFFAPGATRVSPDPARARAHALSEGATLADWLRACLALLSPNGRFAMIHRAEALPAIYEGIGKRLGDIAVTPIHPREGEDAIRIVVTGVKGSRAPARLRAGLTLHERDGAATARARSIHAGRVSLWGDGD